MAPHKKLCPGCNRIQILEELGISVQQLEDCLREFESRLPAEVGRVMEDCFQLDNERIEDVIQVWMGVALGDPERPLETASDSEFDLRLRASYAVLAGIDARHKIMLASQPERTSAREGGINVVAWLQSALIGDASTKKALALESGNAHFSERRFPQMSPEPAS